MIHFYFGDNDFGIKQQISLVKKQFAEKYGNENVVRLSPLGVDQVIAELVNVGLFSNNRLVIIDDIFASNDLVKKLPSILPLVPKDTELIITDSKPDKRTKLYKVLSAENNREFKKPTNLRKFVIDEAKKNKVSIANDAIDELILYTAGDIWRISNEISKLNAIKSSISKKDIEKIVEPSVEIDVFKILDSIFNKQTKQALEKLEVLKRSDDPNYFFSLLSSQIFALSLAKNSNKSSSVVAGETKVHPYLMSKMYNTAQKVTKEEIARVAKIVAYTDDKLKQSNKDDGWSLVSLAIKRIQKTS